MAPLSAGRGTRAVIDLAALRDNFAIVRRFVAPAARVLTVVKADGYGHGAARVAAVFEAAGADWFGVATIEEALELRAAAIGKPILILAGSQAGDVASLCEHKLSTALLDVEMARELASGLASLPGRPRLAVHIKVDTGMGRIGVLPGELAGLLHEIHRLDCFHVEGVFSHFGNADRVDREVSNEQVRVFGSAVATVRQAGFAPPWLHLANSAGTLARQGVHFSLVRPGIVLYGISPSGIATPPGLRPVMRLESRLLQVKSVPAHCAISYSQTFVTQRQTRYGVVPIGYADGYARSLSNSAFMLVRGQRAPVIGAVCMDLTMVDLTDVAGAESGDEVVLWGRQGDQEISVSEVGDWQGSVSYEVLTRLGKRVPRVSAD